MPIPYEDKKQRKGEKMKKNRSFLTLLIVVVLTTLLLTGCLKDIIGGKDDDDETAVDISLSSPANGAVDQQTSVELKWTGSGTTYDVYLDENSSPKTKIANDVSAKTITHSGLAYSTKYYWKVVATKDGTSEESGVWQFTTKVQQTSTLKDGLVAYYPFDGDAKDKSGNGNDGTEHGNPVYVDGVKGKARNFTNGFSYATPSPEHDYITIPVTPNKEQFTWFFFIKVKNVTHMEESLLSYGSTTTGKEWLNIFLDTDFKIQFQVYDGKSSSGAGSKKSEVLDTSKFYSVGLTYQNGIIKLYIDGTLLDTLNYKQLEFNQFNEILIASHKWGSSSQSTRFSGVIDELRIYNRALTQAEITQLYQNGGDPTK